MVKNRKNSHHKNIKNPLNTVETYNKYSSLEDYTNSNTDINENNTEPTEQLNNKKVNKEYKRAQRRPEVAITENYVRQMKIVPGNRTYANAAKQGKKVCLIGDSHLKRIRKNAFNRSINNGNAYINCFSGANSKRLGHYIIPTLMEDQPEIVVIHIGSNDVTHENYDHINIGDLAQKIIDIGKQCLFNGVKEILISSIFLKKQLKLTRIIREINDVLREKCKENNFHFICNDNITRENLWKDDIHLNDEGTHVFASNIVNFLNDFILTGNI